MTNRPKQIGTWTERQIADYLAAGPFPDADRIVLHGTEDEGDIHVCAGVMLQSKGGAVAENASDQQIRVWLGQVEAQRQARGAYFAALVTKRKGKGVKQIGQWWAHMNAKTYVELATADDYMISDDLPNVRFTLDELITLFVRAGFGDTDV